MLPVIGGRTGLRSLRSLVHIIFWGFSSAYISLVEKKLPAVSSPLRLMLDLATCVIRSSRVSLHPS